MHILHINSEKDVSNVDKMIEEGNDVFILVYMEGCGPCNATRPEWSKIESALKEQYSKNDKLVVIELNKDFLLKVKHINEVEGFPTMKYIGNYGKTIETYENSSIKKKDRSVTSFINWIESKITNIISTSSKNSATEVYKRISPTKKVKNSYKKGGGKWTKKYKIRINYKKPKGFSQKQYCKYKKIRKL